MESTKHNPLAYFETLIVFDGLNAIRKKFLSDYTEHSGLKITYVDNIKGIVKFLNYDIESNNIEEYEDYFENNLERDLFTQFNKSKELINEAIAEMTKLGEDYVSFLLLQEKQLQYIINKGNENINLFPLLLKPIIGLKDYMNSKYLNESDKKIILDTPLLNVADRITVNSDDSQVIFSILGYLKNDNEKRQKIMSDEQFDLMIEYVNYYVENNSIPNNITKLDSLKISKNLLRFTFWVLHKRLYTTNSIRQDFILLIKQIFSDFDNWEVDTLKRKFGNRDKVTYNAKHFIPEIIKSELRDFN